MYDEDFDELVMDENLTFKELGEMQDWLNNKIYGQALEVYKKYYEDFKPEKNTGKDFMPEPYHLDRPDEDGIEFGEHSVTLRFRYARHCGCCSDDIYSQELSYEFFTDYDAAAEKLRSERSKEERLNKLKALQEHAQRQRDQEAAEHAQLEKLKRKYPEE